MIWGVVLGRCHFRQIPNWCETATSGSRCPLKTDGAPSNRQLAAAIRRGLRTHRNWNGLTRAVAAAFANMPTEAAEREAWCRELAEDVLDSTDLRMELEDWA